MIASISHRAIHHNSCEDSSFYVEEDGVIYGGVFDGCSTAINSHFASQLYSYAYQSLGDSESPVTTNYITEAVQATIRKTASSLNLSFEHLRTTCVLFSFKKKTETLTVRVFGDGIYYVNGEQFIVDQGNEVDYVGNWIHASELKFEEYLDKYPKKIYADVTSFSVLSDGIKQISRPTLKKADMRVDDPTSFILQPPTAANIFQRRVNILLKDGYQFRDDFSIISYVKDQADVNLPN